ncbi:MAG: winged helix-turn-helix transcriptional regulator [Microbacteriaceae bacterium]|nr:winged helix-turn-helix transcriptional regulator [Microbacteriaceae bacterium]
MTEPAKQPAMPVRGQTLDRSAAEEIARTLRAVADPTRIQMLGLILASPTGETTVGELADALGLRQPTITHHVHILVEDGVVVKEPIGRQVRLSIAPARRASVEDLLR